MKRPLGVALSFVVLLSVVALALVLTGVWSPPWVAQAQPDSNGGISVSQGKDVALPSRDGSPEVRIPAAAFSGDGRLEVRPVDLPEGRHGWSIELSGAQLTGQATLVFKDTVVDGTPPPLVGFTENPDDKPQYVLDADVSGKDLIVRTSHFSNWFTDSWDWLMDWGRGQMDRIYKDTGHGVQPKCEREAEARAGDVVVKSDSGGRVQWCLGKNADGSTVLKVNNSRGYAVAAERSPGMTIIKRDNDFSQLLPKLAKFITAPTKKSNTIDIIGPGETIEYRVDPTGTEGAVGISLEPNAAAYLATALLFGFETVGMVAGKVLGPVSGNDISKAMDAANCVGGFQSMATADVHEARQAGKYLNDAMATVMACTGEVFRKLAKGKMLDVFAVGVAQTFSWLWGGIQTLANGLGAVIDIALNFNGYTLTIWYRGQFSTPSTPPSGPDHMPLPATVTYSGTAEDAKFSFEHPLEWKVGSASPGGLKITNARGEEMGKLTVFAVWDANGAMKARPVTNLPSTPGRTPLSETGPFLVRNVAMDLGPFPEELGMIKWPKPVHLSMSMSAPSPAPEKEMVPFLLYGQAQVETGKLSIGGLTTRLVLFNSSKYFDTMAEVTAYTKTAEYQEIQAMLASFKG